MRVPELPPELDPLLQGPQQRRIQHDGGSGPAQLEVGRVGPHGIDRDADEPLRTVGRN